jgi:hypothetical protein
VKGITLYTFRITRSMNDRQSPAAASARRAATISAFSACHAVKAR